VSSGQLSFRSIAIEDFTLNAGNLSFDLAIAVRVGALDGGHPEVGERQLARIAAATTPEGRLFMDGGDPFVNCCSKSRHVHASGSVTMCQHR
jgi:hypothetical protein